MRNSLSIVAVLALSACNQPPGSPVIAITPEAPSTLDPLVVEVVEAAVDPNEDVVELSYAWTRDGEAVPEVTGDNVPAGQTAKGQVWQVTVTPSDDKQEGLSATAEVEILNSLPTAQLTLSPEAPRTADDLEATVTTDDDDDDDVVVTYTWTKDGVATPQGGATVSASETARGETWEVTAVPNDGEADGEAVTASVVVENVQPVIDSVTLNPVSEVQEAGTIEVTVVAHDDDGDELTHTYTWAINGVDQDGGAELSGDAFSKGDSVSVTVVTNDSFEDSQPVTSSVVSVINTPPVAESASIDPTEAFETTTLTCLPAGWSDADGDTESWRFQWEVAGTVVGTTATLTGADFDKGDVVQCFATPWDGEVEGNRVASATLTVANSLPTLASAALSSLTPREGDTLSLTLGALADDDSDKISVRYRWTVNGTNAGTAATLDSDSFKKGDKIVCEVTPFDGVAAGIAVTTGTATVANTAPVLSSVKTSPGVVRTADSMTALATAADVDGDSITYAYSWTVNGTKVGSSATLASTLFEKGDVVIVSVVASDGTDTSAAMSSAKVTIADTPLSAPVVAIDPQGPSTEDDLYCEIITASVDVDEDPITTTVAWTVDGKTWTGSTSTTDIKGDTIASRDTSNGDEWECTVTAKAGGETERADDSVTIGHFRTFDGTTASKWTSLAVPSDHSYGLQSYASKEFTSYFNVYGANAQKYDPVKNTWTTTRASSPYNSPWTSMAPVGTDLWMVRNLKIYKYDTVKDVWSTVASWTGSDDLSMTESDEYGVVYGHDAAGRIVIYDTTKAPSGSNPSYVSTGKGGEFETRMGYDPGTRSIFFGAYNTNALYKYDIVTKKVTTMASHPERQLNDIFCSDRSGHIYAAGDSSGTTMFQYDVAKNTWKAIVALPTNHGNNGSCFVSDDGHLYVGTGSSRTFYRLGLN